MRRYGFRLAVIALLAFLALSGRGAVAQDATPVAAISTSPEFCTLEPRTLEEVQEIAGEPAPEGEGERIALEIEATPQVDQLPEGEEADAETVAGIRETIIQLFACYNAGHYLAGFAGVTDHFLETQVGVALFDEDFVAAMTAEPVALPEDQHTQLLDIRRVVVMEDGRVAALVDYRSFTPQPEGIDGLETDLFIFLEVDGRWLLDESHENLERIFGPEGIATPENA
jgi:hypothetical protein